MTFVGIEMSLGDGADSSVGVVDKQHFFLCRHMPDLSLYVLLQILHENICEGFFGTNWDKSVADSRVICFMVLICFS
jgi:hypothetical protein